MPDRARAVTQLRSRSPRQRRNLLHRARQYPRAIAEQTAVRWVVNVSTGSCCRPETLGNRRKPEETGAELLPLQVNRKRSSSCPLRPAGIAHRKARREAPSHIALAQADNRRFCRSSLDSAAREIPCLATCRNSTRQNPSCSIPSCRAERYERTETRQHTRAGSY